MEHSSGARTPGPSSYLWTGPAAAGRESVMRAYLPSATLSKDRDGAFAPACMRDDGLDVSHVSIDLDDPTGASTDAALARVREYFDGPSAGGTSARGIIFVVDGRDQSAEADARARESLRALLAEPCAAAASQPGWLPPLVVVAQQLGTAEPSARRARTAADIRHALDLSQQCASTPGGGAQRLCRLVRATHEDRLMAVRLALDFVECAHAHSANAALDPSGHWRLRALDKPVPAGSIPVINGRSQLEVVHPNDIEDDRYSAACHMCPWSAQVLDGGAGAEERASQEPPVVWVVDPFCQDDRLPPAWTAASPRSARPPPPYPALALRCSFGPNSHGGMFWRRPRSPIMREVSLLRRRMRDGRIAIAMAPQWVERFDLAAKLISASALSEPMANAISGASGGPDVSMRNEVARQMCAVKLDREALESHFASPGATGGGRVGTIATRSGETREASLDHIDLEGGLFTVLFPRGVGTLLVPEPRPEELGGAAHGFFTDARRVRPGELRPEDVEAYVALRTRSVCTWWSSDPWYTCFLIGLTRRLAPSAADRVASQLERLTAPGAELFETHRSCDPRRRHCDPPIFAENEEIASVAAGGAYSALAAALSRAAGATTAAVRGGGDADDEDLDAMPSPLARACMSSFIHGVHLAEAPPDFF